jgi:hypothetical protein
MLLYYGFHFINKFSASTQLYNQYSRRPLTSYPQTASSLILAAERSDLLAAAFKFAASNSFLLLIFPSQSSCFLWAASSSYSGNALLSTVRGSGVPSPGLSSCTAASTLDIHTHSWCGCRRIFSMNQVMRPDRVSKGIDEA